MDDQKASRIEQKLDSVDISIKSIDITLAKQSVLLDEHIKRSNLLEAKLQPVEKHVAMVEGALKLVGLISLVLGIISALVLLTSKGK